MSFTYRGLKAVLERHTVTEDDVQQQIERILDENPKIESVTDRPAQLGDEVILDYAGFCEGEQFAGGTAENQPLTLGSGRFIPGFEEQLVGKKIGEETSVFVTFPEVYHSEKLAGKAAEFRCKINEIHVSSRYELNDEFAKNFGGCESMEEFREKLSASMQGYSDDRAEMELQERLISEAADSLDYTPTEEQIKNELNSQLENLSAELAQQGLSLEMYCQFTGSTLEQLKADNRENAINGVRLQAAIDRIVSLENITADEHEIKHALELIARQNGITFDEIKKYCDAEFEKNVVRSVVSAKALRLVRDAAIITVEEVQD